VIDELNNDNLATCLQEIYGLELSALDRTAVNRHAIRLLRYSKALSQGARAGLVKEMLPNLSLTEKLKHRLYNALSAQVT
jgi:hypothetical protein